MTLLKDLRAYTKFRSRFRNIWFCTGKTSPPRIGGVLTGSQQRDCNLKRKKQQLCTRKWEQENNLLIKRSCGCFLSVVLEAELQD